MNSRWWATANVDDELKGVIRLPPTAVRTFGPRDEITVFTELYDNRKNAAAPIALTTMATDDRGRVVFRAEEQLDRQTRDPRHAFRHTVSIPLKDLEPVPAARAGVLVGGHRDSIIGADQAFPLGLSGPG